MDSDTSRKEAVGSTEDVGAAPPGRWTRQARLVGPETQAHLGRCHVAVFGLGGVGSWAVEALARAGIGRLTLVDYDTICPTNTNRQLHALATTAGRPKAEVMAERVRAIHPDCEVMGRAERYDAETSESLLGVPPDYVIDAIDLVTTKCHLIATCRRRGIPLVMSCGAACRLDPTQLQVSDLNHTEGDRFAKAVRKLLRREYGFPTGPDPWGIPAVHSLERPRPPQPLPTDPPAAAKPEVWVPREDRERIGTVGFVTGTFGLVAASVVIRGLIGSSPDGGPR